MRFTVDLTGTTTSRSAAIANEKATDRFQWLDRNMAANGLVLWRRLLREDDPLPRLDRR
jgi:hypothetical protein